MSADQNDPRVLLDKLNDEQLLNIINIGLERVKQDLKKEEAPKHWIWKFIESGFATTLITILLGGYLGSCITANFQNRAKEKEFQQTLLNNRIERDMGAYKEFLNKREVFLQKTFELMDSTLNAYDNFYVYLSTDSEVKVEDMPETEESKNKERTEARKKYFEAKNIWLTKVDSMSNEVTYYFPATSIKSPVNRPSPLSGNGQQTSNNQTPNSNQQTNKTPSPKSPVNKALSTIDMLQDNAVTPEDSAILIFNEIKNSFELYDGCLAKRYQDPLNTKCLQERMNVANNIARLNQLIDKNRFYLWNELNNPQMLGEYLKSIKAALQD